MFDKIFAFPSSPVEDDCEAQCIVQQDDADSQESTSSQPAMSKDVANVESAGTMVLVVPTTPNSTEDDEVVT
jgi:hypothetical protein